jgi:immune inhibitor A
MRNETKWLDGIAHIYRAARANNDGSRCTVAPHPDLKRRIDAEIRKLRASENTVLAPFIRAGEPRRPGLNDGLIIPPDEFGLGASMNMIIATAAERAPLAGVVRVIVVLIDFTDKQMGLAASHYEDLFFSTGVLPTGSVREYYQEVTHGIVDIQGEVVGPYRMPQTLAAYANGHSGLGSALPNASTMARDALAAADPNVNFAPYDNDGNGYVDAFVIIHAGRGGEETGNSGDIWSHKWTLAGGVQTVDGTKVFGYLTVPEDAKIGVCCHELGHLLFGFPDLYDTDGTSEGIGNWCLMAAGSWGGGGDTPVHPSAWCKANQGWASVDNRTTSGPVSISDVKNSHTIYRLWKDGAPGSEYFLLENRQQTGFDASLPNGGLLIWHVDESTPGNTDEAHYKVALMQADGLRGLEASTNRGDGGDPYPGTSNNSSFAGATNPNSKSYAGMPTCVSVTGIGPAGATMNANVQVKCVVKSVLKDSKDQLKEGRKEMKELRKELKDRLIEGKRFPDKRPEKPIIDKATGFDKGTDKLVEGRPWGRGGRGFASRSGREYELRSQDIDARLANIEAILEFILSGEALEGGLPEGSPHLETGGASAAEPFIGSELRPDLGGGALAAEEDRAAQEAMRQGSAFAKRLFDKGSEH